MAWWECRVDGLRWWCPGPPNPPPKPPLPAPPKLGSSGLIMSVMTPVSDRHDELPEPFFFFDFEDSLRFLVWMPSFFMVNGLFTCNNGKIRFSGKYTRNLPVPNLSYNMCRGKCQLYGHSLSGRTIRFLTVSCVYICIYT